MASFHLSINPVCRGEGRSATAAAAYRTGQLVEDWSTGAVFDYTRKGGVAHAEIVLPASALEAKIGWPLDRNALWNAAEAAENRRNSRVAREYEVALPHELTLARNIDLVRDFAAWLANRYCLAVDFALHEPHPDGDQRNHHAHLMTTTRVVAATGLGAKAELELSDRQRAARGLVCAAREIKSIRQCWADLCNQHLSEHGHAARIDHRTLREQRIDREPTTHRGPPDTEKERRTGRERAEQAGGSASIQRSRDH